MGIQTAVDVGSVLKGRSHSSIARAIKVDKSYVTMILNGRRNPSVDTLRDMASHLGFSMDELDRYLRGIRKKVAA